MMPTHLYKRLVRFLLLTAAVSVSAQSADALFDTLTAPVIADSVVSQAAEAPKPAPAATEAPRYAQVLIGPAQVYQELNPSSPVIGMAMRGTIFPLVAEGKSWCKVIYKGKEGWIEREKVEIVDKPDKSFVVKDFLVVAGVLGGILFLFGGAILVSRLRNRVKGEWFSVDAKTDKKVLIVSPGTTMVRRFLGESDASIVSCFTELGCEARAAADANTLQQLAISFRPDIMAVDWRLGANAQSVIEQILSAREATNSVFVLFYNIPDLAAVPRSTILPNTAYLPLGLTEQDLIVALMPALSGSMATVADHGRKNTERSALQGEITDGSLAAIFQFVDIGRKTGCLMIEDDNPSGIVYFNQGIITHATSRHGSGRKALMHILASSSGYFRFVLDRHPKVETMNLPALAVLMEWAKENDEASGNRLR